MTYRIVRKNFFLISLGCVLMFFSAAQAGGLTPIEQLGKIMYQDLDFSYNSTQSCMTCHHHSSGFADPENSRDPVTSVVSTGADGVSKGGRNAPTSAYAGFSPVLEWVEDDDGARTYTGGMFWDGRATGMALGDPLAEQAQGPPLNSVEMKMPDEEAVVEVVRNSSYAALFIQVFGSTSLDDVASAYDYIGQAIAAYERSSQVQKFSSQFDTGRLTQQERQGMTLFEQNCSQCHTAAAPQPGILPLFTNYGYANIGLPVNPLLAGNPIDYGLGGFLESDFSAEFPLINDSAYAAQYGKFKVPTLRNVDRTAPYGHNGVFATLTEMVAFHNSRDTENLWPEPEVNINLSDQVGKMGLSEADIADIIAFLKTLTDEKMMQP